MITMSREEFDAEARAFHTISMSAKVFADTKTPIQLFHLFNEEAAFLLESKDPLSPWSNYSFIGLNPKYFIEDEDEAFVFKNQQKEIICRENIFQQAWEKALAYINVSPKTPDLPFPGGAVGYLGFEAYHFYEPRVASQNTNDNDVFFMFCETILAYHHEKEELTVVHLQDVEPDEAYEIGKKRIHEILLKIEQEVADPVTMTPLSDSLDEDLFEHVTSNYSKVSYMEDVNKIKEYIAAGDIFQAVLSQRFELPVQSDGLSLYRVLRKINPSPYLYYIRCNGQEIIGSSPERLVKVDEDKELEIHPIAGTRKRGKDDKEDQALAADLLADEKERAEHLMLVDLARNDIGRVSEYGSVAVKDMMHVSYFSHVMHLTTKVTGQLKKKAHPFEALFSTHPAGTVSGAPKVRAVEIIQQLEQSRRGVYAGAIAYCGYNEVIDSCIAIRTIVLDQEVAYVQAGAGIVQDSVPESEYEETRNKAKALIYAIKLAEMRYQQEEVTKR
ncbi:anthranilate synthase component I [Salipaludibacillus keqinensis]|uniref:Anthranilate synthase component 1 n=1 Tax=Salipaludibacillus keqinensis TaxID=2045207 RepID=A0A323TYA3_9BACI|nr:anthranilate synthase component I [Salipaludibacillus keqinensis]PYZ94515.1 anthranilate synthase component I [Salipaludibacillus keqinensis]